MSVSRNANGAIAFLLVVPVAHNWSILSNVFDPPWQEWPPVTPLMDNWVVPFLHHIYRPILIGLTGLTVFWIWEGRQAGFLLALALMAVASIFGVSITIFNALQGEWSGVFTCAIAFAYPAVMVLWIAGRGYLDEGRQPGASPAPG